MALLRVNELPHVLSQLTAQRPSPDLPGGALEGRVLGALLMGRHGALLGSSGFDADGFHPSPKVVSAIVSNVWAEYATSPNAVRSSGRPSPLRGGPSPLPPSVAQACVKPCIAC